LPDAKDQYVGREFAQLAQLGENVFDVLLVRSFDYPTIFLNTDKKTKHLKCLRNLLIIVVPFETYNPQIRGSV